jgi:hypothetical protein
MELSIRASLAHEHGRIPLVNPQFSYVTWDAVFLDTFQLKIKKVISNQVSSVIDLPVFTKKIIEVLS